MRNKNQITDKPIPTDELEQDLNDPSCGGVVTFIGKVRNHHEGKQVTRLTYEAYAPMAENIFSKIAAEAIQKFGVHDVHIVHRVGDLKIGDVAVWVGVQSGHRAEAFEACRYVIDELKKRAPIWKKEHYANAESGWVGCRCAEDEIPPNPPFAKGGVAIHPPLKKGDKGGFKLAVILAGGKSSRFGSDKLFAELNGKTLIETAIETLRSSGFDIVISGPKEKFSRFGLPVIEDEYPHEGPLRALSSIWKKITPDRIFVVAGDMPFITPAVIDKLWKKGERADVTILSGTGGPSPLPGVYSRKTQKTIARLIKEGRRDLFSLLDKGLIVETIDKNKFALGNKAEQSLVNINTQNDLDGHQWRV